MSISEELQDLVARAWEQGIVVTVYQVSPPPYAMGHYYTHISTRPANERASSILIIETDDDDNDAVDNT